MKKKTRNGLLVLVLLLAIGFAAVSTTLIINGTALFGTNTDDFEVIFTKSIIDGIDVSEFTISEDGKSLTFTTSELAIINDTSVLNFVVTNNSTLYDASVTMECVVTGEKANTYYKVESDLPEVINAASKENGNVTVTLLKTSVDEIEETFTCTISATATERTELGKAKLEWDYIDSDADGVISEGDVYTLGNESFNVISQTEDTVTMLSANSLGADYRQTAATAHSEIGVIFASSSGWEYAPGPKEIDIIIWAPNISNYIDSYVSYLQTQTNAASISGDLITLAELKKLGCTINENYFSNTGITTCTNSEHVSWLGNGQNWWTRSAVDDSNNSNLIWEVYDTGNLGYRPSSRLAQTDYGLGVRPVITISKDTLNNL